MSAVVEDYFALPVSEQPPPVPVDEGRSNESGLGVWSALVVAGLALLASFGMQSLAGDQADPTKELDGQIRLSLVITLGFYVLLGGAVAGFCMLRRVRLTWVRGSGVEALLWGLPLGAAGGGLAVLLNSQISGHLSSDPSIELLVGGGGALRIALTLAVTAMLAPLVEETVFRGILAGTLLSRGPAPAVWVSAIAFSVWHMNATSLRYYVFMGLLLATLWRKRGLVASMVAHAAFNGVLTIAAVSATTIGTQHATLGAVSFTLPAGWHQAGQVGDRDLVIDGPGGAAMSIIRGFDQQQQPSLEDMSLGFQRAAALTGGKWVMNPGSERRVRVPAGAAVVNDVTIMGQRGHLLGLIVNGESYQIIFISAGSPAAEKGWPGILRSVTAS